MIALPRAVNELPTNSASMYHVIAISCNRPFSKLAAENSNRSILKTYTSTRRNAFTLVTLQSFNLSGVISAEKM